jgi:adenylate cyclase
MVVQGRAIREEQAGLRVLVDLRRMDKASAVKTLESIISRLMA